MSANIYEVMRTQIKYPGTRHDGDFGVEIETESASKYEYPNLRFWSCTKDNSLRNYGVEYVLKVPMNSRELQSAFSEFEVCKKKYKFLKDTVSTSVHVHMNVLNETYLTLANILATYSLVENLMIIYSGPDRLSNLFCLPMRDAEGVVESIKHVLNAINMKNIKRTMQSVDQVKYGAINLAPLTKLGTVEFRSFRGETDTEVINTWIGILEDLKKYAKVEGRTPATILLDYKNKGDGILKDIFSKQSYEALTHKDQKDLLQKNLYYLASIATCSKDWTKFGVWAKKKVYREKLTVELNDLAAQHHGKMYSELNWIERTHVDEIYMRNNLNVSIVDMDGDL